MAITRVQGNARGTTASNSSTTTVTMANTPTSGNIMVACIGVGSATLSLTVSSIAETGVTWTGSGNGLQASKLNAGVQATVDTEIWIGTVGPGASKTITITYSASIGLSGIAVADVSEYSGLAAASSILDVTATNFGNGSNGSTGTTATTAQAVELWIGSIYDFDTLGTGDATQSAATNGFSLLDGASTNRGVTSASEGYLEKIVSATGTASTGVTFNDTAQNSWVGCIATFKGVSAATGQLIISHRVIGF